MEKTEILKLLSVPDKGQRLYNLERLLSREPIPTPKPEYANNHIHTTFSFSPYSPTAAIWFAREAGLLTAGIMDHDSIGGADEFRRAGMLAGIGTTCGLECRVTLAGTLFENKKINNPDQVGVAYMAIHSVPHRSFERIQRFFAPLRERRNVRNRAMVARINEIMAPHRISLDFEHDVLLNTMYHHGGSITERHLNWALGEKIIERKGEHKVIEFLERELGLMISARQRKWLGEANPLYFPYDLLGVLKSSLNPHIYIPATEELLELDQLVELCEETGAILCYPYLGDIEDSSTGDKKAEKFEDDYLDLLFEFLHERGVRGITFMPSRNTRVQLERLMALCRKYGMHEICGEDINQPRQSFICPELAEPAFSHLVGAAWGIVEREKTD